MESDTNPTQPPCAVAPPVHDSSFSVHHPGPPTPPPLPPQRLHPLTLLFTVWTALRSVLIPAIILFFLSRGEGRSFWTGIVYLLVVSFGTVYTLVHYFTFSYRVAGGDLVIRHGVLQRTERHIPLSRVQDVRMTQGVLHRLLGVFDVEVETAGGKGEEAKLSVLSHNDAEQLRAAVFEQRQAVAVPGQVAGASVETPSQPASALPERQVLRQVGVAELALAGLTSNRVASGLAIIAALWAFLDDLLPVGFYERNVERFGRWFWRWLAAGADPFWLVKVSVLVLVVFLLGATFSVAGSIIAFYGFALSRSGEDLHRAHGLFTRHASSLPRKRIQLLKIDEGFLRRLAGLATLRANTAGSVEQNDEGKGLDVLLPAIRRSEVERLLPAIFPDLCEQSPDWQRVSRRAIRRATFKGALGCALLASAAFIFTRQLTALWFFALMPVIHVLNVVSYRHLGYALDGRFFRTRRGAWSRSTHIVPVRNIQTVSLKQSPFDRRHRVMRLIVDTAGQGPAGTGPEIANVPVEAALRLAAGLAQEASRTRYRW